jgi:hypothetical protein
VPRYSLLVLLFLFVLGLAAQGTAQPGLEGTGSGVDRSPAITGPATSEPVNPGENGASYPANSGALRLPADLFSNGRGSSLLRALARRSSSSDSTAPDQSPRR